MPRMVNVKNPRGGRFFAPSAGGGGGGGGGVTTESGIVALDASQNSANSDQQMGWRFTVAGNDLTVRKLRVYDVASGEETLRLWRVSDQTLLASVTVTAVADAWSEADLASPVTLTAGQDYIVTTRRTDGTSRAYVYDQAAGQAFSSGLMPVESRLHTTDAFPTQVIADSLYGIPDVVYDEIADDTQTGLYSASGWDATANLTNYQLGWEFTVGAAALTVSALRLYTEASRTERVQLWRESDQALIAAADVTANGYGETAITPVVLTAGAAYIVTGHYAGARSMPWNPSAYEFNPSATYVTGRFVVGDGFPSSSTDNFYIAPDIRFDV